ncbi:DUF2786 domain-containing protein [Clostridium sp. 19966]|uniref:DUF2786 domain-containing protein n=1 Tax=Clostridium sp. 19966 TaxID=2768166 RepID=UPI0028DF05E1|nr:DUF2786 domain-containing protein [Clostridium sp. 19966]MDT8718295.1 DUF2786 domain-containing protein [Clostridium sp. 19966]
MDKIEVINKILKVYSKSKNNPSEEETRVALLKVQEMLIKYNLTLKDLNVKEDVQEIKKIHYGNRCRWWHSSLANLLAKNFRCKMYLNDHYGGKSIVFIGEEIDVEVCGKTFEYIKDSIAYNCKIHMSKRKIRLKDNIKRTKESFILGFITGLKYALTDREKSNQWELALVTPVKVQEFYNNLELTNFEWDIDDRNDDKAFEDGYKQGKIFDPKLGKQCISEFRR